MFNKLALAVVLGLAPLASAGGSKDIVQTAIDAGSFKTLATALTEAGLVETLQGDGPFTVFAPTDDAFGRLPEGTVASLLEPGNRERLVAILTYHVVPGRVSSAQVVELDAAATVNGQRVDIAADASGVTVDGARVQTVDIACSNGIIHVIDRVLLPSDRNLVETASAAGNFGTLLAAAKAAGLVDTLTGDGPLTVLAPSDAAFAKLPDGTVENLLKPENREQLAAILTYHVLPGRVYADEALSRREFKTVQQSPVRFAVDGGKVTVSGAGVVATDIEASNGVIHVIDAVLMPPAEARDNAHAPASSCSSTTDWS